MESNNHNIKILGKNTLNVSTQNFKVVSKKFETDYLLIKQMRKEIEAPVDTMGLKSCLDSDVDFEVYKYQALVSLLLSSQTKDNTTYAAMKKLISHGLTIESVLKLTEKDIVEFIYGVSFHNNKAKNILKMTETIKNDYDCKPPENYKEIIKLPGIGPKMTYIYLTDVLKKNEGIGIDTHIHKISNRLNWVNNTKTPEKTRKELEQIVHKKYWKEINEILVGFGQQICKTVKPLCGDCLLKKHCSFYKTIIKAKSKSKSKSKKSKSKSKSKPKINVEKRRTPKKLSKIRYTDE